MLKKCQMRVDMQPIAQPFFQKLNVDNSCQETRKIRYYIFKVLSKFTVFSKILTHILARIVRGNKFFAVTWSSLLDTLIIGYFL